MRHDSKLYIPGRGNEMNKLSVGRYIIYFIKIILHVRKMCQVCARRIEISFECCLLPAAVPAYLLSSV